MITLKKVLVIAFCLLVLIALVLLLAFSPLIDLLKECEGRAWDGSEYNTGVRDVKLFEDSEDIIVKCTKAPEETDAIIDVLDALPLVKIRSVEE